MRTVETTGSITAAAVSERMELASRFEQLDCASRLIVGMKGDVPIQALDTLVQQVTNSAGPAEIIAWVRTLPNSAAAAYLQARFSQFESDVQLRACKWDTFFSQTKCRDPFVLLRYVQALCDAERFPDAAQQLRRALSYSPPYAFFAKADHTVRRVLQHDLLPARRCRIGILASSTTGLMVPVLRAVCFRDGIHAEFYEGTYGAFRQEILDPSSGLYRFQPDVVFVAVHWRDLGLGGVSNDLECVERVCAGHQQLWQLLTERTQCAVVQHSFDLPPDEASGYFSDAAAGGRGRIIQRINEALIEAAPANVSILNIQRVAASVGAAWENPALWYRAKQHPSPEALPALAERQIAHLRAISGLTKKVLVCDLDNTLWGGVIGEDGLDGIEVGPGSARSEAYADFQRYLLELKAQGVLLAVCSKNNMDEALLPFAKHEHMILRHTDFVAFVANWNDKASNIRAIAHELSLGTDSFVFVDDNPLEREWVRSQMPEVAVVELGQHPYSFVRDLDRCNYFFSLVSSTEDRNRTISYRSEKAREQLRDSAASLDGFLQSLKLRARCVPISSGNLARVAQLVNKTNQFNFTAKRYTEAQIQQLAAIPGAWVRAFQLADGFGDYGLIGVMICLPTSEGEWIVDSWLMSCRSLGRGMEKFMFNHMAQAAQRANITNIGLSYRKTAKNGLVEVLPLQLGFKHIGTLGDETLYESELSKLGQQQTFIADESPETIEIAKPVANAPSSLAESGSGRLNQQPQPSIAFQTASGQVAH